MAQITAQTLKELGGKELDDRAIQRDFRNTEVAVQWLPPLSRHRVQFTQYMKRTKLDIQ